MRHDVAMGALYWRLEVSAGGCRFTMNKAAKTNLDLHRTMGAIRGNDEKGPVIVIG